ncbi:ankyrin repeat domain-containing protein 45 isoform X2 [Girardinichthys multiradiatus]|uniref:ankyrin repeat domain-containing protein 45 isoform X2 n=1 Tax=Girardinichthys multiradiatus TaxID=208333 RepID=UPI001FAE1A0F|nr:ankyrin repeat domain-containing protein 45 isoform X2 [Girardinichthys multiradiatus]
MAAVILGIVMTSKQDEIFNGVLSGDLENIKQLLESSDGSEESHEHDLFGKVDEMGRNALLTASMLGKSSIVRELVKHGAKVDGQTVRGYTSLHLAACWGHLDTVRTLLELGADTQAKTFRGERPVDLARRYSQADCTDCLTQAEHGQEDIIPDSEGHQEAHPLQVTSAAFYSPNSKRSCLTSS